MKIARMPISGRFAVGRMFSKEDAYQRSMIPVYIEESPENCQDRLIERAMECLRHRIGQYASNNISLKIDLSWVQKTEGDEITEVELWVKYQEVEPFNE